MRHDTKESKHKEARTRRRCCSHCHGGVGEACRPPREAGSKSEVRRRRQDDDPERAELAKVLEHRCARVPRRVRRPADDHPRRAARAPVDPQRSPNPPFTRLDGEGPALRNDDDAALPRPERHGDCHAPVRVFVRKRIITWRRGSLYLRRASARRPFAPGARTPQPRRRDE